MTIQVCNEPYKRPTGEVLLCTFVHDHNPGPGHSWQDIADEDAVPVMELQRVLLAIEVGVFDNDLEQLLAAAHNRKIALRSGRSRRR